MSENKRDPDMADFPGARASRGNASPTGIGTHVRHRTKAEEDNADQEDEGRVGRNAGEDKDDTRPG